MNRGNIVRGVKIAGTGSYVPERICTNEELEQSAPTTAKWIEANLGIRERRIARPDQATSDLAVEAAKRALEHAKMKVSDVSLIIVATATPDRLAPSTACIVQDKLGACNAVAFDVSAVCSGFLFGMSIASQFLAAGTYNNALVIGADTFSKIIDWTRRDCCFFGDGAGAAVLTHEPADSQKGFLSFRLYSDGHGREGFTIPGGGSEFPASAETIKNRLHYFKMDGKAVYEAGTKVLPVAIKEVLKDTGLTINDIDFLIPHQPSIRILKKTAEILGLPFERVMTNMDRYANTAGGTIPILLDEVNRSGRLTSGKHVLFAAVGAGWTWGAAIIRWC